MEKVKVTSYSQIADSIRGRKSDAMKNLYNMAADIHVDIFDMNFSRVIGSAPEKILALEDRIKKNRKDFTAKLKETFDTPFELKQHEIFNEIIMPATKI